MSSRRRPLVIASLIFVAVAVVALGGSLSGMLMTALPFVRLFDGAVKNRPARG